MTTFIRLVRLNNTTNEETECVIESMRINVWCRINEGIGVRRTSDGCRMTVTKRWFHMLFADIIVLRDNETQNSDVSKGCWKMWWTGLCGFLKTIQNQWTIKEFVQILVSFRTNCSILTCQSWRCWLLMPFMYASKQALNPKHVNFKISLWHPSRKGYNLVRFCKKATRKTVS